MLSRRLALCAFGFLLGSTAYAQPPQTLSVPVDSPRWDLQGEVKVTEYQGRKCLLLNGGAAILKDFEMRDGVIDVDVATPAKRGFFGFDFRLDKDGTNYEEVYLRQHKSGLPDAMQYTPVLNTGRNWQIYNGPGFTGAVDIPKDEWFHLRLEVMGAQAKLYVKDMDKNKPALVMDDLKSGVQKGQVALYDLTGATYFSNFEVRTTPDAPWERHLPPIPQDTLTKWSLSPSYDALARNLEHPLSAAESDSIHWQDVEAEPPGFVVLYRYREAASEGHVSGRLFEAFGTPAGDEGLICADRDRFRPRPGEETRDRLQRRRQRVPEWQDSLSRPKRPRFPRPRVPWHREPGERRRLPPLEEGQQ